MLKTHENSQIVIQKSITESIRNREPSEIIALLDLIIDSRFEIFGVEFSDYEMEIINRVRKSKLVIDNKLLHIFEAPLNPIDFKDLINLMINTIIESAFEEAVKNGTISEVEEEIIVNLLSKLIIY